MIRMQTLRQCTELLTVLKLTQANRTDSILIPHRAHALMVFMGRDELGHRVLDAVRRHLNLGDERPGWRQPWAGPEAVAPTDGDAMVDCDHKSCRSDPYKKYCNFIAINVAIVVIISHCRDLISKNCYLLSHIEEGDENYMAVTADGDCKMSIV